VRGSLRRTLRRATWRALWLSLRSGRTRIARSVVALIRARIVSAASAHLIAFVVRHFEPDFVIAAIKHVIRGLISDGILVAKLVADVLKRLVEIIHVIREKRAPAGFFGKVLKNLVAIGEVIFSVACFLGISFRERNPLRAGADGVNDDTGALRELDGFGACVEG